MAEPYLGQIKMFAGNFAPAGWAFCNGQLLTIASNSALFSLLGTTYGGDGQSTFALPDMRGRIPHHVGSGPGLPPLAWGRKGGQETVSLTTGEIPTHTHSIDAVSPREANSSNPRGHVPARVTVEAAYAPSSDSTVSGNTQPAGNGQAHDNMPPFVCVSFIIALQGIFPSRS